LFNTGITFDFIGGVWYYFFSKYFFIFFMNTTIQDCLKEEMPELELTMLQQLNNYLSVVKQINQLRGRDARTDQERELAMFKLKCAQFIYSRNVRIQDISSAEVVEAVELKKQLFPYGIPKLMICVDGRVLSKLFAGLQGNALRTPGGDSSEFKPRKNGEGIFLSTDSILAQILFRALRAHDHEVLVQVLDSHVGCKARGDEEENREGHMLADKGRYRDVVRKKNIGTELVTLAQQQEEFKGKKNVVIIQTSFDPHSGYLVMGLEKEACLEFPLAQQEGYTEEVVRQLTAQGLVVNAEDLVENSVDTRIKDIFERHKFVIDYEKDYRNSTLTFWKTIAALQEQVLPLINEKMMRVFDYLQQPHYEKELNQRSLLLLANAFNAYLHHHNRAYPYKDHDESVIVVTYSEKGPYDRARSFSVDPDNPNLSGIIEFTANLIRDNRRNGRMSETERPAVEKLFPERQEYVGKPIPLFLFERIFEFSQDIERIRTTDWSDIAVLDWMTMTDKEFFDYLESKIKDITMVAAQAINTLRQRAIKLFQFAQPATNALLEGRIIPVWQLLGPDRQLIALVPFLTKGYDDEEVKQNA
jgi:hypothetical protein